MNTAYIFCAYFALFVLGLIDMARGPIYPEILDAFDVGPATGSYFFTVASLAGLLINLISHRWLSRWGSYKSLRIFILFQWVGCFGMGWAGGLAHGFVWLLVFAFIFGISLGAIGIVINLLVVEGSPDSRHGRLLSGLHTMYGLAALLAPLMVTRVLAWQDWRFCFYLMAIGPFALFIYMLWAKPLRTSQKAVKKRTRLSAVGRQLAAAMALYVGAEMAISTRMVVYLRHELQWAGERSAFYLGLFFFGLMSGRLLHSLWGNRVADATVLLSGMVLSILSFLYGLFVDPAGLSFCGLTMAAVFPTMVAIAAKIRREESERIVAVGLTGVGLVLILMHWGVGFLAELLNVRLALLIGPIFLGASLLLLLRLKSHFSEGISLEKAV